MAISIVGESDPAHKSWGHDCRFMLIARLTIVLSNCCLELPLAMDHKLMKGKYGFENLICGSIY